MFSYGIFKSNIKRFWIVPVVATIILFLVTTFQMILRTNDIKERRTDYINDVIVLDAEKAEYTDIVNQQNRIEASTINQDYSSDIVMINAPTSDISDENIIAITNTEITNNITNNTINNTTNSVTNNIQVVDENNTYINEQYYSPNNYDREHYIEILYNPIVLFIIFVLPVLVSILLFKYTNEEKSSSFIHGLPISKRKLYITNILTGIVMYVIPFLVNLIIILLLNLGEMGKYLQFTDIIKWFGVCMLYNTMFFAFATFIGTFCASKISHGLLTYILMYAPVGILVLTSAFVEDILYGFKGFSTNIEEFTKLPFIKIIEDFREMSAYYLSQTIKLEASTIIIYIIAIIIMLVLGYFIYKRRKLEITKEFIAFKGIRSFVKYAATFLVNLLSYMYFYYVMDEHKIQTLLASFIITLIAYLIIEMILKKTYKVFKSIIGFIIYAVIITIAFIILNTGAFGYETRIPKVEDVQEVSFEVRNETINFKEKQNIENIINLQQKIVDEKKKGYNEYTLEYKLKDGRKIIRKYAINNSLYKEELNKILTSNEYYEEKVKQISDIQKIKKISININYKNQYSTKTITIKELDKSDFIENLIKDIKSRKATINDNYYVAEIARKNGELRSIYVEIDLKEEASKTVRYIDFENINIEKYLN